MKMTMEITLNNAPNLKTTPSSSSPLLYYSLGLITVFIAVFSQYILPPFGLIPKFALIYGLPILVISLLYGRAIITRAFKNNARAINYGLAYWGVLSALSYISGMIILTLLANFNPESITLLDQPNPVVPHSTYLIWLMVPISLLIIGPAEEYIFRGFVFGRLLHLFQGKHWFLLALFSSFIFAIVHLYYLLTFGLASAIIFTDIMAIGLALAVAYYASGGNLLVPTLLHGLFDAAGFIGIATGSNFGSYFRGSIVIVGILLAVILISQRYILNSSKNKITAPGKCLQC